jgi:predicted phage terminase large subunit-like protein
MKKRPNITELRFDQWTADLKKWIVESVSPFEEDSPEKQKERKDRAEWDKLYFMRTYLPHYFYGEFGDFHEEWGDLGDLKDECAFVAAPREHAKSTFFTFGDLIHDICFELRRFILVISDTNNQATGFTLPIRLELEDNPRLRHDFGDLTGRSWAKNDFTTNNGVRVLARGRGEKVRGLKNRQYRPDKAVVDDFENDENVKNPRLVKDGKDWLLKAVIGSLGVGFCFIMIGNIFHPKSILSQFMNETDGEGEKLYISKIYKAILDEGTPDERPLWPSAWPIERLYAKRRTMGSRIFNEEMMNLTGAENSPFPEKWFKYYERITLVMPEILVATFVDPSAKNNEANDFRAIVTVGLHRQSMIFKCLHAWIRHASVGEMFKAAYAQHASYGGRMGVEENMLKDFLHEAIYNYAKEIGLYLPWEAVHHSTNKEARIIGTLSYLVEHEKLLFDKGHSDQDLLIEQCVYILNANIHDDGPDALEGSVKMLQGGAGAWKVESKSAEPRESARLEDYCVVEGRAGVAGW